MLKKSVNFAKIKLFKTMVKLVKNNAITVLNVSEHLLIKSP